MPNLSVLVSSIRNSLAKVSDSNSFYICIRANANQSEPIQKTFYNFFDEKRQKINPTISDLIRGNNPNQSETKYSIRIIPTSDSFGLILHGETFYINFYYSIFQFREKCITLRIFVSKNTKLYNNDM